MLILNPFCKYNFRTMSISQKYYSKIKNQAIPLKSSKTRSMSNENFEKVQLVLEKFNIDTSNIKKYKRIFKESPWIVEKRIVFLQELGVTKVSADLIVNFTRAMNLSVFTFKAHTLIDPKVSLIENLFSKLDNCDIDYKSLSYLSEHSSVKFYYTECLIHYLKSILNLNNDQVNLLGHIKYRPLLFNSFYLLQKLLKILRNNLYFDSNLLFKNKWLLGHHPEYIETISNLLINDLEMPIKLILKYPKLLNSDIEDLRNKVLLFKEYKITPQMIQRSYKNNQIINFSSTVFKRRINNLLKNPFTLIYQKHQRFLNLINHYNTTITRTRFLQEKNLKYATIDSLTTFCNPIDKLIKFKKTTSRDLQSFLEVQFKEDAQKILQQLKRHEYYRYVSLVQMNETLSYLKNRFSKNIIYKHVYAILYNKVDIESAYKTLHQDPKYCHLRGNQLLALCIYKIEEQTHFTGEAVLVNDRYVELHADNAIQEKIKEATKEHIHTSHGKKKKIQ